MSLGKPLGTFTGDGNFVHNCTSYASSKYSLFLNGSFDGGTISVLGGDGTNFVPVMLTDPTDGAVHVAVQIGTNSGLYTFEALCAFLKIVLAGSGSPDLEVTLFPEPRS